MDSQIVGEVEELRFCGSVLPFAGVACQRNQFPRAFADRQRSLGPAAVHHQMVPYWLFGDAQENGKNVEAIRRRVGGKLAAN